MLKENYQIDESKTKLHQCRLYQGNCLEKLGDFSNSSIHLVITDPPYFLDGMGSRWDKDILEQKAAKGETIKGLPVGMKFDPKQGLEFQKFYEKISKEIIRVLKPGGFFLSFSQPRLLHRMGVAVEDAGFEIRDQYAWRFTKKAQAKAFSQNHFVNKMKISDHKKEIIKQKLGNRKTPQLRPEFVTCAPSFLHSKGESLVRMVAFCCGRCKPSWGMPQLGFGRVFSGGGSA